MPLWSPSQKGRLGPADCNTGILELGGPLAGTAHASDSTLYGAIVEQIASTAYDGFWIDIMVFDTAYNGLKRTMMEVLIGGSGSEVVLIPSMLIGQVGLNLAAGPPGPRRFGFPLYIPKGSRISTRIAATDASYADTMCIITIFGDEYRRGFTGSRVEALGLGTIPGGTSFTIGLFGVWSTWLELTASSSNEYIALMPSLALADSTGQNRHESIELGVGAAGNEQSLGHWVFRANQSEGLRGPWPNIPAMGRIPAGSRIALRGRTSFSNRNDMEVMAYGVIA